MAMASEVDTMDEAVRQVLADIDIRDLDHLDVYQELISSLLTSSQSSNKQNLLMKLLSKDHAGRSHPQLALKLILAMSSRPETWGSLIRKTLSTDCSQLIAADRGNGILHEAALNGSCYALADFPDHCSVNLANRCRETPLHLAAMMGNACDVKVLLVAGADAGRTDADGCTPLHAAAQSANPNCEVARLLLDAFDNREDQTHSCLSDKDRNTPLHVAAGNVNSSDEFIQILFGLQQHRFKLNRDNDTPFHVAAKSNNQSTLIEMLNCLRATRRNFSIDQLDAGRGPEQMTLMELAAVAGNSKAVGLMIQNGADIGYRLLHTIAGESARDPSKTDHLIAVYRAIVDNALHWRSVHEREKFPVGDLVYFQRRMQTVTYLLTRREDAPESRNVIEHAIDLGAHRMLDAIVNTENVFCFSENPFERSSSLTVNDELQHGYSGTWHVVTNFVSATESPQPSINNPAENTNDPEKGTATPTTTAENTVRDFDKIFKPRRPYLTSIVLRNSLKWRKTNILLSEPFLELTAPFVKFVQRIYVLLALIQFLYMSLFAVFCSPTACSLSQRFDVFLPSCNHPSSEKREESTTPSLLWLIWPLVMLLSSSGYLISVCIRSVLNKFRSGRPKFVASSVKSCDSSHIATTPSSLEDQSNEGETKLHSSSCSSPSTSLGSEGQDEIDGNFVSVRPSSAVFVDNNITLTTSTATNGSLASSGSVAATTSLTSTAPRKPRSCSVQDCQNISVVTINLLPLIAFSVAVFLWYIESLFSVTMSTYVQTTSMVFLFGWVTSFVFFSAIKREFYLFSLVMREFIAKDVCYKFIPLFFFTVVAFSFAISLLKLQTISVGEVGYELILIASAVADPFDQKTDSQKGADRPWLLQTVLTVYVYWTAVILLNVLIAMMNHRYDAAKVRAEREWRFRSVEIAMAIQNNSLYCRIMRFVACGHPALCRFLRCDGQYWKDSQQFLVATVKSIKHKPPMSSDAQLA